MLKEAFRLIYVRMVLVHAHYEMCAEPHCRVLSGRDLTLAQFFFELWAA